MMNMTRAMIVAGAVLGSMANSTTLAQGTEADSQTQELKQIHDDLRKEIADLKKEVAALKRLVADLTKTVADAKAAAAKPAQRERPAMTMLGKKAPESTVTTIDDRKITIGGKRDKPQVLFCYASWCGFCKKSLPWMESLHQKYKDKGVEEVALNLDTRGEGGRARTEEQTLKNYRDLNLTLPMTMTTATNNTSRIGAVYKARSFPTLFVLGPSGEVESVHIGAKQGLDKIVGAELDLLLAGKTRKDFPK